MKVVHGITHKGYKLLSGVAVVKNGLSNAFEVAGKTAKLPKDVSCIILHFCITQLRETHRIHHCTDRQHNMVKCVAHHSHAQC